MNISKQASWSSFLSIALGVLALAALTASSWGQPKAKHDTQAVDAQGAPMFRVDPFWPKPLPNRWSMQQVTGLYVEEKNDHVWFLNRGAAADGDEIGGDGNPPRIDCCVRGPEVIELDPEGNVVNAWGGPGYHSPVARRRCRPSSLTAKATSGSAEPRRKTAS